MIGIVEFQKNQLLSFRRYLICNQFKNNAISGFPDLLDDSFLSTLSTDDLVPVVFTLSLITQHGLQSWYLIFLTASVFLLLTISLAIAIGI